MAAKIKFSPDVLDIDAQSETELICTFIRESVHDILHKKGVVIAVSGGVDSAVCATLCARALGKDRVQILFLPERDSSPESLRLGTQIASSLEVHATTEEITPMLEGAGCYRRQREAIQKVFPEYQESWKNKITIPSILDGTRLNVSRLTVQTPTGEMRSERMPADVYLQLVAATNFKQRIRTMMTSCHADRLNYAVCGTPNRLEYDQGFFVKVGDGSADIKPIAHLYKSQVYALARALGVPDEICRRLPTSDTFSIPQTQEEFYFALPYDKMDLCLYAKNHNVPSSEVAPVVGLTADQVERINTDIESKRRSTRYLHLPPLTPSAIPEIILLSEAAKHRKENY